MYGRWFNTNATTAASMLDVTDSIILGWSNGEVTSPERYTEDGEESGDTTGTLVDLSIFGDPKEGHLKMGHISLPVPVVNIHYTRGKRPVLPALLKMEPGDLDKVIYFSDLVVTDPGESAFQYKQVITRKEYTENSGCAGFKALSGAEAIKTLLDKENISGADNIVLSCLPVVPFEMRYVYKDCNGPFSPTGIERLYERVLNRKCRIVRLMQYGVPEIILLNEWRMLQETVDALVDNGARGIPVSGPDGAPLDSLTELYEWTVQSPSKRSRKIKMEGKPDTTKMEKVLDEFAESLKDTGEDGEDSEEYPLDDEEYREKWGRLLCEAFSPLCEAVIAENFPAYDGDFHEQMVWWGTVSITKAADQFLWLRNRKQVDMVKFFSKVFYKNILFFVKKKAMYE